MWGKSKTSFPYIKGLVREEIYRIHSRISAKIRVLTDGVLE